MVAYPTSTTRRPGAAALGALLVLGTLLAGGVRAEVKPDQPPANYVKIIVDKPGSADSFQAQAFLIANPDKAAVAGAISKDWADHDELPKAMLAGVRLAMAEAPPGDPMGDHARKVLQGGNKNATRVVLEALANGAHRDAMVVDTLLPALAQDTDPAIQNAAQRAQAKMDSLKGSGILTFFILIIVTGVGFVLWGASFATELDPLKGHIQDWTARPMDREDILKQVKQVDDHVTKLLGYFGEKTLSSAEIAGLCDLMSNFDQPPVHAKIKEMAGSDSDMIKSAAIQAMAPFADASWEATLVDLVQNGDEVSRFAASKGLAERGAIGQLGLLRQLHEAAIPGSVKDGLGDAIERLEIAERARNMQQS